MADTLPEAYEPGPPQADEQFDTHLDVALDDEQPATHQQVFVDVVAKQDTRLPIIPASFRGKENLKATVKYHAGRTGHRVGYHAVRAVPVYAPKATFWALIGLFRLAGRALRWWWDPEMSGLLSEAANKGDLHEGPRIADKLAERRKTRGYFLLAALLVLAGGVTVAWFQAPRWALVAAVLLAVPWLAHAGRPKTMPIVSAAVVTPRFRRINPDIVIRAYEVAGLCKSDKPSQELKFASQMNRDSRETYSWVDIDLPYGKGWKDMVKPETKSAIASGLDVTVNQVFFTRDNDSERRHRLMISDRDPLAVSVGVTELIDCKRRSIWEPIKLGKDERGDLVKLNLMWISLLIGSQPRKGKTFFARLVGLYAALDPNVKIFFADGKMSPDWNKFSLVAHRTVIGDSPNARDDDPLQHLEDMLDEILEHIDTVNEELSQLPVEMCPEGKLTRALHEDPRYPNLKVWLLLMEEFQVYFETIDQKYNLRIAQKLARIQAVGPSAGVVVASSSQKPAGVGAGDVSRLFNRFRDNHTVRFALRCGNRLVSEAVLGGDAYGEGYDASSLPIGDGTNGTKDYRGVGILYGASDRTPTLRSFLADHLHAEKILRAARALRERLGTLSGQAAGEKANRERRDVMADALSVFYAGEAWISWPELAMRMAQIMPEHYEDLTAEAISAQLRALKVPSVDGRDKTQGNKVVKGAKVAAVQAAIERRDLELAR